MFKALEKINARPKVFEFYTASDLWTDDHTSKQMISYHLNKEMVFPSLAVRNKARFYRKTRAGLNKLDKKPYNG